MHENRATCCRGSTGEASGHACPPPMENPVCAAFGEYGEVPKTVPFDFTEYDVNWVASKLSGAVGVLGAEAIELRNWLLRFGCLSEDLRAVVARLDYWMANYSPTWAAYCTLMACRLVALDKRPGVLPVGIGETLRRDLAKLVMRADGDQAKTVCGNLQLCTGLKSGIEGATHIVDQRRIKRVRAMRIEETAVDGSTAKEEGRGGIADTQNNLRIDTAETEEEAAEQLEDVMGWRSMRQAK